MSLPQPLLGLVFGCLSVRDALYSARPVCKTWSTVRAVWSKVSFPTALHVCEPNAVRVAMVLSSELETCLHEFRNLVEINVRSLEAEDAAKCLELLSAAASRLEGLSLRIHTKVDTVHSWPLPGLAALVLEGCGWVNDRLLALVVQTCSQLKKLNVSYTNVTGRGLSAACPSLPLLRELSAKDVRGVERHLHELAVHCPRLSELDLLDRSWDTTVPSFSELTSLRSLSLGFPKHVQKSRFPASLSSLLLRYSEFDCLEPPTGLRELCLPHCDLSRCGIGALAHLANLRVLDLFGSKMGNSADFGVLRHCSSLRVINIKDVQGYIDWPLLAALDVETLHCNDLKDVPIRGWDRLRTLHLWQATMLGVMTMVSVKKTLKRVEWIEADVYDCAYVSGSVFIDGRLVFEARFQ